MKRLFLILSTLFAVNNFGMEAVQPKPVQILVKPSNSENAVAVSEEVLNKFQVLKEQKQNIEEGTELAALVDESTLNLLFDLATVPEDLPEGVDERSFIASKISDFDNSLLIKLFERASFLDFEYLDLFVPVIAHKFNNFSIQELLSLPPDLQRLIANRMEGFGLGKKLDISVPGHRYINRICSISITVDGRRFVSGSSGENIYVWNLNEDGTLSGAGPVATLHANHPLLGLINACAQLVSISANGRRVIASNNYEVKIWNLNEDGTSSGAGPVATLPRLEDHYRNWISFISITADGRRVVLIRGGQVEIWNLNEDGTLSGVGPVATLSKSTAGYKDYFKISISADGRRIASSGVDADGYSVVKVWNLNEDGTLSDSSPVATIEQPLGDHEDDDYYTESEEEFYSQFDGGYKGIISSLAISADGRRMAYGSERSIEVWNLNEDGTLSGYDPVATISKCSEYESPVLAVSADGRRMVYRSRRSINVWDLNEDGTLSGDDPVATLSKSGEDDFSSIAVSADGIRVVAGINSDPAKVVVWNSLCNVLPLSVVYVIARGQLTKDEIEFLKQEIDFDSLSPSVKTYLANKGISKE